MGSDHRWRQPQAQARFARVGANSSEYTIQDIDFILPSFTIHSGGKPAQADVENLTAQDCRQNRPPPAPHASGLRPKSRA